MIICISLQRDLITQSYNDVYILLLVIAAEDDDDGDELPTTMTRDVF